jgi:D-amino-acid dehydrogenase
LTLAAVTGELVADLMTGGAPAIDLSPFAIDRFRKMMP